MGFGFGGGSTATPAKSPGYSSGDQWKYLPQQMCVTWQRNSDDSSWIMLFKRFVVHGGDLASLTETSPQISAFELIAGATNFPGLAVFEFLLKFGAPIVLVGANKQSHDAFTAVVDSIARHPASPVPHVAAVLKRFVTAGYTVLQPRLASLIAASRSNSEAHAYLISLHSGSGLALMPTHFDGALQCAQALAELDVADASVSGPACEALLARLLRDDNFWTDKNAPHAPVLLRRLRDLLPTVVVETLLRGVLTSVAEENASAMHEVLSMTSELENDPELRLAVLAKAIRARRATDLRLVALAFDRTRLDVNCLLGSTTPPLVLAVSQGSSVDVVRMLLAKGADVNGHQIDDGSTPLHRSQSAEIDEVLVRAGGDLTLKRHSDNMSARDLIATISDVDRRWFHLKVAPIIVQHLKHAELLSICIAIAPLLNEFPPEVIDRIVTNLPGMRALDEGMRYSLFVRIGAAHAKKLDGESVDLPARDPVVAHKPVTVKEIASTDALDDGGSRPRQRVTDDDSGQGDTPHDVQLATLVPQLMSANKVDVHSAVVAVRKLLSIANAPPINAVINAGIVPRLVELAASDDPKMVYEALWAITNICSGTSDDVQVAISCGAMNVLLAALRSPLDDVREQAVWGIGNIAGDSPRMRDLVLASGVVDAFVEFMTTSSRLSMLRNVCWAASNLCRGKPQPDRSLVAPLVPIMARMTFTTDEEVLTDAAWSISYLSDGPNESIQAVIESGVTPRLVQLLSHQSFSVQTPALRALGNIVTGDDMQTQQVLNCNFLPALLPLLVSPKRGIRKEAAWAMSNITAGNSTQIGAVIDSGVLPAVINLLGSHDADVAKEAAWVVANLASGGTREQIRYVVNLGAIPMFKPLLSQADARVITVALSFYRDTLKSGASTDEPDNPYVTMMEEADVISSLEDLQSHANQEVYRQAAELLENYFNGEEEEQTPVDVMSGFKD